MEFIFVAVVVIGSVALPYFKSKFNLKAESKFFLGMADAGFKTCLSENPGGCLGFGRGISLDSTSLEAFSLGTGNENYDDFKSRLQAFGAPGLDYSGSVDINELYTRLNKGRTCYAVNICQVISSGKNTSVHYHGFLIYEFGVFLPTITVRPENAFDKVAQWVGVRDIEFESEEFNQKFHVSSVDQKLAFEVFDPQMLDFMLSGYATPEFVVFGHFIMFQISKEMWLQNLNPTEEFVNSFESHIPGYLARERAFKSAAPLFTPNEFSHQLKLNEALKNAKHS